MPIVRVLCLAFALLFATLALPHPAAAQTGDSLYKQDTLDKFKVGPREKRGALALVGSVKADIVEKP
jgi:hypothetical protein